MNKQETLEEAKKSFGETWATLTKEQSEYLREYINRQREDAKKLQQERSYSEEEVELIANEMVNWAIDNIGNPNPQSGKKFDEVMAKFKNK